MGKAVVIIFFIIGFVVFSMIKYAGAGIKAAYKHVNDGLDPHPNRDQPSNAHNKDPGAVLTKMILETLQAQIAFSGSYSKPNLSKDDFVIGYVAGYVEGCVQTTNNKLTEAERFGILSITFFEIFEHEKGVELLKAIIQSPESMSGKFANGWSTATEEVHQWLGAGIDEERKTPTQLMQHLHGDTH